MALKKGIKQLIADAEAKTKGISAADAVAKLEDTNTVFVDLRDVRELERDGMIPGAFHAPRGMLEFWVDPDSPYYREEFGSGKKFIFFCAGGMRSALACQSVHRMGLAPVAHMKGGFGAWVKAGGPVEAREAKLPKPKS